MSRDPFGKRADILEDMALTLLEINARSALLQLQEASRWGLPDVELYRVLAIIYDRAGKLKQSQEFEAKHIAELPKRHGSMEACRCDVVVA